jgi:hypothetical protein
MALDKRRKTEDLWMEYNNHSPNITFNFFFNVIERNWKWLTANTLPVDEITIQDI